MTFFNRLFALPARLVSALARLYLVAPRSHSLARSYLVPVRSHLVPPRSHLVPARSHLVPARLLIARARLLTSPASDSEHLGEVGAPLRVRVVHRNKRSAVVFLLVALLSFCFPSQNTSAQDLTQEQVFEAMSLTAKAFRSATDKVRPSLVTIESFGGVSAVQGKIGGIRKQGEGNSTGVLLSSDGIVITSTFNFIQRPPVITVITADGERRVAKMLGQDDTRKLCVLKIQDVQDLPVPEFLDPKTLTVGQWAVSVGVGYGDTNPAISMGIISATNRVGGRAIQTDANISPANYGGPLIDIDGRVIGICVPMHPQSQAIGAGVEWYDSGIGFAIPLHGADELLERLIKGERIYPAFLGVSPVPNESGDGVLIEEIIPTTPAAAAGLERGDCILKLAGEEVNDVMTLKQILNRFEAGQEIELEYRPYEKEKTKEVTLILVSPPRPKGEPEQLEPPKIR